MRAHCYSTGDATYFVSDKPINTPSAGGDPFADTKLGNALARAIVDTIHEPFVVLDANLRVIVASRSFYEKFQVNQEETQGRLLYDIGNGQWNISALKHFLQHIISGHEVMTEYKIAHNFLTIGWRTMMLSAREVEYDGNQRKHLLLTIVDISERELLDIEKEKLSKQKDLMMKELKHRMANSLQLIASILILKSEAVESPEVRAPLHDAHERILSLATIENDLYATGVNDDIEAGPYLTRLCASLSQSMIGSNKPVTIKVESAVGTTTSSEGISLGLITTELVINALKHAFPDGKQGKIVVEYSVSKGGWKLMVSDNGVGIVVVPTRKGSLGTIIVQSLARQLGATVERKTSPKGTSVSIEHSLMGASGMPLLTP